MSKRGSYARIFDSDWRPDRSPDSREWSKYWWYKFTWIGELIRKSTKQTNKRIAEQMEAAHRTALAKGEVGIRERKRVPILKEFAEQDFLSFVRSTFAAKPKTLAYYENGTNRLLAFEQLASERLGAISTDRVGEYVATRHEAKGKVGSRLQVAVLGPESIDPVNGDTGLHSGGNRFRQGSFREPRLPGRGPGHAVLLLLDGNLAIRFRRVSGDLVFIFVYDVRQMPTLVDFDMMPVQSKRVDQFPDLRDALLRTCFKPKDSSVGREPLRRSRQVLVEPNQNLANPTQLLLI